MRIAYSKENRSVLFATILSILLCFASVSGTVRASVLSQESETETSEVQVEGKLAYRHTTEHKRLRQLREQERHELFHPRTRQRGTTLRVISFQGKTCFWSDHPVPLRAPPAIA